MFNSKCSVSDTRHWEHAFSRANHIRQKRMHLVKLKPLIARLSPQCALFLVDVSTPSDVHLYAGQNGLRFLITLIS